MNSSVLSTMGHAFAGSRAIRLLIAAVLGAWSSAPAFAGSTGPGLVTQMVVVQIEGVVLLQTSAAIAAPAHCPVLPGPSTGWTFSLSNPGGRSMFNQLLHAQTLGYPVEIYGTGSCAHWNLVREEVLYVRVNYP